MVKKERAPALFPATEPYAGYFSVGDGHDLYYEECGNPDGIPILYLHGGPGIGCSKDAHRLFHPEKYRIILFDQRGSGRSKPQGSIHANTTLHLVQDIYRLLEKLKIDNVVLFGGSWGSTLALVFDINYPNLIRGMILHGIFLAEQKECETYLTGQSAHSRFPEAHRRLLHHVPPHARKNPADYYFAMMTSDNAHIRYLYAYEWAYYEFSRACLVPLPDEQLKKKILSGSVVSSGAIELHYLRNFYFLEDGYILRNAYHLPSVPLSIIHGRYDDLCPIENASRLHDALPASTLHVVNAGHAHTDAEILKKSIEETQRMAAQCIKPVP